uniref:Uncharacterized protein n=1 Tax=Kwoniella dejecticola CBS 10117 TaxID=1296121 RepID=A0A1A6AGI7_9TREE|nr:uncharacterized protein I303_00995 [Kwoniella dejecticola CBS 10117]OBR89172.1 hypothetical protein I303_00995 [Kwoniella dejecticola CBS 10117]
MPKARKSSLRVKHNKLGPLSSPLKPSSTSPSKLVEAAIPLDDKDVQQEDSPSLLSLSSTPWSDSMANEHLTIDEKRALSILHQLCAFEQVLMEFFTGLDGLDISPVKGSLVLSYDRVELFVNPQTGRQARRADDIKELEGMIKAITKSQIDAKDNVVPRSYLLRIQDNFLSALRNPFVHLRESAQVPGQVGLFVRPKDNASGKKKSRPPNLEGIRFELFSFPRKIVSPEDHGFLDDLSFDYTHRRVGERESKKYILIGLGMARVINHHCTRDKVEWPFAPNGLKFKDGHKEIGVMSSELVLKRGKSLVAGSEVFGYYGDEFARLDCSPSSTPPKPQKRQNPYIDLESASRADSMDLDSIRMEGSSRVHVHQSPLGPFDRFIQARNLDRDTDDAAPKGISGRKKKRRKSRKHDSSQDHDDHPVAAGDDNDIQYLSDGIGIAAGHLRSTTPKRRKKGSISKAGVIEIDQDQDALEVVSLFSSLRASVVPDDGADNVLVPESSGNAAEEPTPSPSPPSTSDIMNRMMQLDERIEDQLDILQDREQQFDKLIADLIDLKEVVQRDAKVLAQLRRQQKGLIKGITEILTKTGKATLEESRPAGGRSHQSVSVCSSYSSIAPSIMLNLWRVSQRKVENAASEAPEGLSPTSIHAEPIEIPSSDEDVAYGSPETIFSTSSDGDGYDQIMRNMEEDNLTKEEADAIHLLH